MTRRALRTRLLFAATLPWLGAASAQAAAVTNIRIAAHPDHVRVVLDLDAAVTFAVTPDGSLDLKGLEGENAVLNAAPSEVPLKRVVITPGTGAARLTFETTTPVNPRAFTMSPDKDGGNRLVVDLYPKGAPAKSEPPAAQADTPLTDKLTPTPATGTTAAVTGAATAALPAVPAPASKLELNAGEAAIPGMPPEAALDAPGLPPTSFAAPATIPNTDVATASDAKAGPGYSDEALRAERALDRGDLKDGCARADALTKIDPKDLRALVVLGACRLAQQDALGAKGAYTAALDIDPGFDRARVGLATAEDMLGNHTAARAELSRVLGHDVPPDDLAKLIAAFKELPLAQSAPKPVAATN